MDMARGQRAGTPSFLSRLSARRLALHPGGGRYSLVVRHMFALDHLLLGMFLRRNTKADRCGRLFHQSDSPAERSPRSIGRRLLLWLIDALHNSTLGTCVKAFSGERVPRSAAKVSGAGLNVSDPRGAGEPPLRALEPLHANHEHDG